MRVIPFLALGVVAVFLGGIACASLTAPTPYPLPVANITVSLPQSPSYRQLTIGSFNDRWSAWSPDGVNAAFSSDQGASTTSG